MLGVPPSGGALWDMLGVPPSGGGSARAPCAAGRALRPESTSPVNSRVPPSGVFNPFFNPFLLTPAGSSRDSSSTMNWTAIVCPWRLRKLEWRRFIIGPLCVSFFGFSTPILPAATLTTLYSFTNGVDGANPWAGLVQGSDGSFYGTTSEGGTTCFGSVFKITSGGALTPLYSFTNGIDGARPDALVQGSDGNFYGATWSFTTLSISPQGLGTIFKITSGGALTTLHSFMSWTIDSSYPVGLVQGSDGNFYGTTEYGGTKGGGTIFKITSGGALTPLYSFTNGIDGADPEASLVQGSDGSFYGTTYEGGTTGFGTIFKITSGGALTPLYSFTNGIDGGVPRAGLVQGSDGNFYGTAAGGGTKGFGTIFKITSSGVLTPLYSFTNGVDGATPVAGLIQGSDGNFYGTAAGGESRGYGTVFRLSLSDSPFIVTQPHGQSVPAGASPAFNVVADGQQPLSYQWQINGKPISGQTLATLSLNNVQPSDSGGYSVVVTNAFGKVTSAVAQLYVYLPSSTPQPQTPAATSTTLTRPSSLTAAPGTPNPAQLVVYPAGAVVDPTKMTIVLTHGWIPTDGPDPTQDGWPADMAATLIKQGFGATANIVARDWHEDATSPFPPTGPTTRTLSQGYNLGKALLKTLGFGYNQPIHFLGHSLGTMVNCHAADCMHGDVDPSVTGRPSWTFHPYNTQMTMFDEAELIAGLDYSDNPLAALGVDIGVLFAAPDAALAGIASSPCIKVIPNRSAWIDNYVSEVGIASPRSRQRAPVAALWSSPRVRPLWCWGNVFSAWVFIPLVLQHDRIPNPRRDGQWLIFRAKYVGGHEQG